MPWTHQQTVRLRHTDAAAVIFYPRLFEMAHEAYEVLLDEMGQPLKNALAASDPIAPIVRCEANYRRPMRVGDVVDITLSVVREGKASFTLGFDFRSPAGGELARAEVTHAAIDRTSGKSVPLSEAMRQGLASLRD